MKKKVIISLDITRGIAAIVVLLSHSRAYLFLDYKLLPANEINIFVDFFYFITGLGHESVMIFFVLSGFLVAGSVQRNFNNNTFSWKLYLINRLSRLWIVFIPALFLTLFWDKIGILITGSDYYNGALGDVLAVGPNAPVEHNYSVFLKNTLFLQNIISPVFGTNGVVWSLANEFWYYILFPFCLSLINNIRQIKYFKILLIISIIGVILKFLPVEIINGFGIWLIGYLAYVLINKTNLSKYLNKIIPRILILILFIFILGISRIYKDFNLLNEYLVGVIYSLVLISFYNIEIKNVSIKRFFNVLSNISYTLYLVHVPIIVFVFTVILNEERFSITINAFIFLAILLLFISLYTYVTYLLFEKNTTYLKNLITNKLKL
jgi:peptidoglycan/LPS O-acetylase OafA/YrhL